MNISFHTDKGTGYGYASILRQTLIASTVSVKPIAFMLSEGSMYKCGPNEIDNMQLGAKLADLTFKVSENSSLPLTINCTVKGKLMSSDLCKDGDVTVEEKDVVLIEQIDPSKELSINIILDKNSGFKSHTFNRRSLEYQKYDMKGFNVISARYTDVTVKQEDPIDDLDSEIVNLSVSSKSGDERVKVLAAIDKIIGTFEELKKKI